MDPAAVIEEARGDIDEALLTGTRGGFLGRHVLADRPLLEYLSEEERLQYLLAGPAPPVRVRDGAAEQLEASGSYRTLLAVTDERLLLVVGSDDGDRAESLPYGEVVDVRHEAGLLTEAVQVEASARVTWEVPVGGGSDVDEAVAYASDRIAAAAPGTGSGRRLIGAVFRGLVADAEGPSVEGGLPSDLDELLADLEAHHGRVVAHLEEGDPAAARAAAATVEAIAAEAVRLAEVEDRPTTRRRAVSFRGSARRLVVAEAVGVADPGDVLEALGPALLRILQGLDAGKFERFVADLWGELGYQTTVTRATREGGIDVVARRTTPVEQTVVILARRYGPGTSVDRADVRQYARLQRQEPDADLVVVVTTGSVSAPAVEAATDLGVKLVDGERLVDVVTDRELYDLVARYVGD